jgi:hypothetical protein
MLLTTAQTKVKAYSKWQTKATGNIVAIKIPTRLKQNVLNANT